MMTAVRLFSGMALFNSIMVSARFVATFMIVSVLIDWEVDILHLLCEVIFFLAAIMLISYIVFDLIAPNAGLVAYYDDIVRADGTKSYALYHIHYGFYARWATTAPLFGWSFPRFSGFCWEPGQYMIYLNYTLFYLLFMEKKLKISRLVIVGISLFLTCSATGWIIAVLLVFLWNLNRRKSIGKYIMFVVCLLGGAAGIALIIMEKAETSIASFEGRTGDLKLIGDLLLRNSLFGTTETVRDMTNSFIRVMWYYGYIGVILLVILCLLYYKNKCLFPNRTIKIAFAVWLILSLVNEPLEVANITSFIISLIILTTEIQKTVSEKLEASIYGKKYTRFTRRKL
ncbi:hypothetical protein [Clostridium sp. D5]|uniref:hypothetical protein n=1 Tax=Clostridium sp. D5 TaxID=556261 RepID=UPI0018DE7019|nr:hypothetical protein [Clostridium sp. D5]